MTHATPRSEESSDGHSSRPAHQGAPRRDLAHRALLAMGSLGPLGHMPASGTVTVALVGIPLFWASRDVGTVLYVLGLIVLTLASVWVHQRGDALLGAKDSRILVLDEIVGFLVAVIGVPFTWQTVVLAFVLERGLDIFKFWPARLVEDRWPGGWGVVGDDVVAGLYTLAGLHVLLWLAPGAMT